MHNKICINKPYDPGLILIFICAQIFVVSFSVINILKFKIFSTTTFGWVYAHMYPKLARLENPFSFCALPEFNIAPFLFPVVFLFAFIYNLLPSPEMLFIFQEIMLSSGAIAVYLIARGRLRNGYLAFSFSILYLLHPIITTGAVLGYTPLAQGLPFLLYAFYFLEKRSFIKFIFFIIIANMTKIDVVMISLILGIILSFSTDKERKKYGKITLILSLIWLMVITVFCATYLRLIHRDFPVGLLHFDQYGDSFMQIFTYFWSNPSRFLANLFDRNNMLDYVFSFPLNILSLFSPLFLIPALPEIVFIIIRNQHSSGHFLTLAFIFITSIYGTAKIAGLLGGLAAKRKLSNLNRLFLNSLATFILLFAMLRHYYIKPTTYFPEDIGPLPFTRNFNLNFYAATDRVKTGYKFIENIPIGASCLTSQNLAPHLSRCSRLWLVDKEAFKQKYRWDYIFVDLLKNDFYPLTKKELLFELKRSLSGGDYGVAGFEDGWLLLKKGYTEEKTRKY